MYVSVYGWERYINIEETFITARQYISFDNDNAYSDFFTRTVIVLGAEIEAAFKKLCEKLGNPNSGNMTQYKQTILGKYPSIVKWKVKMLGTCKEFQPFKDWQNALAWWSIYTDVKHNLVDKDATLKVSLDMLAAYQTLIFAIQVKKGASEGKQEVVVCSLANQPRLLIPDGEMIKFLTGGNDGDEDDMGFYIAFDPGKVDKALQSP